jgi:hypothetical protein
MSLMDIWEQIGKFEENHPEIEFWFAPIMIGIYQTCQGLSDKDNLEAIYRHFFGDEATKYCSQCRHKLDSVIEHPENYKLLVGQYRFKKRHPEIANWVTELISTYVTCQGLTNPTDDFEAMYDHLKGCRRCKERLMREIEHQNKFANPPIKIDRSLLELLRG